MMSPRRGAVRNNGREYKINRIFVASGFDEKGPITGFHVTLKDGPKPIIQGGSDLTIQLETAEAYELAMRLLDQVRIAHEKHGGGFLEVA
jgi:hypothetical protein